MGIRILHTRHCFRAARRTLKGPEVLGGSRAASGVQPKWVQVPLAPFITLHPTRIWGWTERDTPGPGTASISPSINVQGYKPLWESYHQKQSFVQTGAGQQILGHFSTWYRNEGWQVCLDCIRLLLWQIKRLTILFPLFLSKIFQC